LRSDHKLIPFRRQFQKGAEMIKRILLGSAAVIAILAAVVIVRTMNFVPPTLEPVERVSLDLDSDAMAQRLSQAIQFETVSNQPPIPLDPIPFDAFIAWLEATYPNVHQTMSRELIAGYTVLLKWEGSDPSLKPVLLTAHYDVVPVIPGTEDIWEQEPYSGKIDDGWIWGRGALDDKSAVIAQIEAVSHLIDAGFTPKRTIYLSFGHDEEIGGDTGAAGVAAHLKAQGVQLEWSLDEGGFILDGIMEGVDVPIATVNVAEKGFLTIEMIASAQGGHSSMPPKETAVGILAKAIINLQNAPLPGGLDGLTGEMYGNIGRHMPFGIRMALANQWLLGGVLDWQLSRQPTANAMMRTTTAPTMLSASIKENVLPIKAIGTVNFRLHPRDTVEGVIEHVRQAVNDDRIEIKVVRGTSASEVSRTDTQAFEAITLTTREVFGDVVVTPGLLVAGTDTKHYATVADNAYRYNPMRVTPEIMGTFHGTNERITIDSLVQGAVFYIQLLKKETGEVQ
jgi:carboxypeptidase PM20D1